eukprot:3300146-Rhodomonas_salina.1
MGIVGSRRRDLLRPLRHLAPPFYPGMPMRRPQYWTVSTGPAKRLRPPQYDSICAYAGISTVACYDTTRRCVGPDLGHEVVRADDLPDVHLA